MASPMSARERAAQFVSSSRRPAHGEYLLSLPSSWAPLAKLSHAEVSKRTNFINFMPGHADTEVIGVERSRTDRLREELQAKHPDESRHMINLMVYAEERRLDALDREEQVRFNQQLIERKRQQALKKMEAIRLPRLLDASGNEVPLGSATARAWMREHNPEMYQHYTAMLRDGQRAQNDTNYERSETVRVERAAAASQRAEAKLVRRDESLATVRAAAETERIEKAKDLQVKLATATKRVTTEARRQEKEALAAAEASDAAVERRRARVATDMENRNTQQRIARDAAIEAAASSRRQRETTREEAAAARLHAHEVQLARSEQRRRQVAAEATHHFATESTSQDKATTIRADKNQEAVEKRNQAAEKINVKEAHVAAALVEKAQVHADYVQRNEVRLATHTAAYREVLATTQSQRIKAVNSTLGSIYNHRMARDAKISEDAARHGTSLDEKTQRARENQALLRKAHQADLEALASSSSPRRQRRDTSSSPIRSNAGVSPRGTSPVSAASPRTPHKPSSFRGNSFYQRSQRTSPMPAESSRCDAEDEVDSASEGSEGQRHCDRENAAQSNRMKVAEAEEHHRRRILDKIRLRESQVESKMAEKHVTLSERKAERTAKEKAMRTARIAEVEAKHAELDHYNKLLLQPQPEKRQHSPPKSVTARDRKPVDPFDRPQSTRTPRVRSRESCTGRENAERRLELSGTFRSTTTGRDATVVGIERHVSPTARRRAEIHDELAASRRALAEKAAAKQCAGAQRRTQSLQERREAHIEANEARFGEHDKNARDIADNRLTAGDKLLAARAAGNAVSAHRRDDYLTQRAERQAARRNERMAQADRIREVKAREREALLAASRSNTNANRIRAVYDDDDMGLLLTLSGRRESSPDASEAFFSPNRGAVRSPDSTFGASQTLSGSRTQQRRTKAEL
jgi:hypothetical protein